MKIVIVDDDDSILAMLGIFLPTVGFEIIGSARDGLEGLALLTSLRPDCVLIDAIMPRMDGLELGVQLRLLPDLKDLPLIMLSAAPDRREAALRAGFNAFISKPFSIVTFGDQIRMVVQKKS